MSQKRGSGWAGTWHTNWLGKKPGVDDSTKNLGEATGEWGLKKDIISECGEGEKAKEYSRNNLFRITGTVKKACFGNIGKVGCHEKDMSLFINAEGSIHTKKPEAGVGSSYGEPKRKTGAEEKI